ncbi:MAG: nitrous oxide reductase family maturation protein NosD [Deltaproteobacteria bacterium]|nr:nitrous oxide reductase family maturation protein NosD [Deltaproteobacteria bacterium]
MHKSPAILGLILISGCGGGDSVPEAILSGSSILSRPEGCRGLPAADLETALATALPGDRLCLEPGEFVGRVIVPEGVTVFGPRTAVIRTQGTGTTVTLTSSSALIGLTVDGSGGRFDVLDAAVRISGDDVRVLGIAVRNSIFGILSEKSKRAVIVGNHVVGSGGVALGMRGDGIRLWETNDSRVEDNLVEASRDCVVWYSGRNLVRRNRVVGGRYGVHLMYSHDNRVLDNRFESNEVGVFVMYSRNARIERNRMLGSDGASGIGLGLKESGALTIRQNWLIRNTTGIFSDNSPMDEGQTNRFEDNELRLSNVGVNFLSSPQHNEFRRNLFHDNFAQVRVDGGGDAMGVVWDQNDWDDYAGYDLDGDELGDIPYTLEDLGAELEARYPDLAFLHGTPALALVSVAGRAVPLFAPKPILVDPAPRFGRRR